MSKPDVLIIGAGLAGLCCARTLQGHSVSFEILESSDGIGGRVRTDRHEGFLLDRGFQVLLTAYPEAREHLNYPQLGLRPFLPGAIVRYHGHFLRVSDPWKDPGSLFSNLFASVGSISDKFRLLKLRHELRRKSIPEIFAGEETSAMLGLRMRGFSTRIIDTFFRPFLGGILLDSRLTASSRMFEFAFKMISEGDTSLPEQGMGAIPAQLAQALPDSSFRMGTKARTLRPGEVILESGESIRAKTVVVATDGPEACHLLGSSRSINSRSTSVLYFAVQEPPIRDPILVLNGGGPGPVNSVCVPNIVQPSYAPEGHWLVSVTVIGWPTNDDKILENLVRAQLRRWYGLAVMEWRLLQTYRIQHAHPVIHPMEWQQPQRLADGLYVCGDHRSTPSIQGAMESGRLAAESLMREFGVLPGPSDPIAEGSWQFGQARAARA